MPEIIIIKKDNKPYFVGLTADVKPQEYLSLVKECEERHEQEIKEKDDLIERLDTCEKKIKELTGRILLDEGKITKEDFENGNY